VTNMQRVEPLDPDSPKGREVAERLGNVLFEIKREMVQQGRWTMEDELAACAALPHEGGGGKDLPN
jgi:hypothetical protein